MGIATLFRVATPDWDTLREKMIAEQLQTRGISDTRVIDAMRQVPRHRFIPEATRARAYEDRALPIGLQQTISQPYMVATSLQALNLSGGEKVLEIGTGTGYQAALLGLLAREVHSVEIVSPLADEARSHLAALELPNVQIYVSDGSQGLPSEAPFDAIVVAAAAPDVPQVLLNQLAPEGRLLIPIGSRTEQILTLLEKRQNQLIRRTLNSCAFVPLLGMHGWPAA